MPRKHAELSEPPKVFRDPVHNLITFDQPERRFLLDLVNSSEFQRLRRIRQLGLSGFTFHGAEHTRFTHSMGTYHLAKQIIASLKARSDQYPQLYERVEKRRLEILVAALLHDVGHGPFSHVLEKSFMPDRPVAKAPDYPRNHEGWSRRIIEDRYQNNSLHNGLDWKYVLSLLSERREPKDPVPDIISSQIDADRLDYLLRDSYAAGVPYGRFDLEWLLHSLRLGEVELKGHSGQMPRLCFQSPKARAIVEQYIVARQCMYLQVYTHKTTRAYEALLRHVFGLARHILDNGDGLPFPSPVLEKAIRRQPLSLGEYLELDDSVVWAALRAWVKIKGRKERIRMLRRKCDILVNRGRPYRMIEVSSEDLESQGKAAAAIAALEAQSELGRFCCHYDTFRDTPYKSIFYGTAKEREEKEVRSIYMLDSKGRTLLAEEDSKMIRQLSDVPMQVYRMYYDDEEADVVSLLRDKGFDAKEGRK